MASSVAPRKGIAAAFSASSTVVSSDASILIVAFDELTCTAGASGKKFGSV